MAFRRGAALPAAIAKVRIETGRLRRGGRRSFHLSDQRDRAVAGRRQAQSCLSERGPDMPTWIFCHVLQMSSDDRRLMHRLLFLQKDPQKVTHQTTRPYISSRHQHEQNFKKMDLTAYPNLNSHTRFQPPCTESVPGGLQFCNYTHDFPLEKTFHSTVACLNRSDTHCTRAALC